MKHMKSFVWRRLLRGVMAAALLVASLTVQPVGSVAEGGAPVADSHSRPAPSVRSSALTDTFTNIGTGTDIVLYPGTVDVPDAIVPAIKRALRDVKVPMPAYAITNLECDPDFCIASFVGFKELLVSVAGKIEWTLSDASELGALVIARGLDGMYRGARTGSDSYLDLVSGSTSGIAARLRDSSRRLSD